MQISEAETGNFYKCFRFYKIGCKRAMAAPKYILRILKGNGNRIKFPVLVQILVFVSV